ncbi:MAG: hypothetical protein WA175_04575 [Candidatus Acidiferrales bacterium]
MAVEPTADNRAAYQRRSRRLRLRIRVVVRFQDKKAPAEQTHTMTVNAHGGLILLATPVSVNQFVVIENPKLGQEILCRITTLGPSFMGKAQIAVEFIKPAPGFWGLDSPPEDWEDGRPEGSRHQFPEVLRGS